VRLVGKPITARKPIRPKLKTIWQCARLFCYTHGVQEIPSPLIAVIDDDESMCQDRSAINSPPPVHTVGNQTISAADSVPSIMVPIRRN
jgi:hypothetical protein